MEEIKPRYEFRIWADALGSIRERLENLAQPKKTESEETYLISAVTEKCNAKIRAALMDIKLLVAVDRGLEQWRPIMKGEFPLSESVISGQVFPSLKVAPPPLITSYSLEEFLSLMEATPEIAVVRVRKIRYQFKIGVCAAEFAQVTLDNVPRDTVAVESVDADAVIQLVRDLGIPGANVSYIREMKRILETVPTKR